MGFRNGCYASVWEIKGSESGKYTDVKISITKKRQDTGEYVQDFSGTVRFIGNANETIKPYIGRTVGAERKPIVRLKLDSVDATVTKVAKSDGSGDFWYHGYNCFECTLVGHDQTQSQARREQTRPQYDPSIPENAVDEELPFS